MQLLVQHYGYTFVTGLSLSLALSILYVAVIYTHKPKSAQRTESGAIDRNDPVLVKFRVSIVSAFTVFTLVVIPIVVSVSSGRPLGFIYAQFGILPGCTYDEGLKFSLHKLILSIRDIFQSLALVSILFIGPLSDYILNATTPTTIITDWFDEVSTIHGMRDLIAGPLTEEIVYTAGIIVILLQVPKMTEGMLIYLPPLFFSVAHFHHAYEMYTSNVPMRIIVLSTVFQMSYTFLFGIFTNFVFLRQDNLWSCFALHSFCNFMGVPKLQVDTTKVAYWEWIYYALLGVGAYLFKTLLFPLTKSSLELIY